MKDIKQHCRFSCTELTTKSCCSLLRTAFLANCFLKKITSRVIIFTFIYKYHFSKQRWIRWPCSLTLQKTINAILGQYIYILCKACHHSPQSKKGVILEPITFRWKVYICLYIFESVLNTFIFAGISTLYIYISSPLCKEPCKLQVTKMQADSKKKKM